MMKRHQSRWLAWLLILCVWMSSFSLVAAEEVSPKNEQEILVIAMDLKEDPRGNNDLYYAAMSLLKPGLRIAKQRKCVIRVLDTVDGVNQRFSGADSGAAEQAFERIGNGTIGDVQQHLAQTAVDVCASIAEGARGNLFMVSRLDRLDRTSGQQRYVTDFYNAFKSMLDRAPGMSVHFVWLSDKKNTAPVDVELSNAYPGRVTAIVLSRDNVDELIAQELIQLAGTTFTQQSIGDMTARDKTVTIPFTQEITSDVLLQIGFADGDPMPKEIKLTAGTPDAVNVSEAEGDAEATAAMPPEVTVEPDEEELPVPEITDAPASTESTATATPEATDEPDEEELPVPEITDAPASTESTATAAPEATDEPDEEELPALTITAAPESTESTATATPEATDEPDEKITEIPQTAEGTETAVPGLNMNPEELPALEIADTPEPDKHTEAPTTAAPEATVEPDEEITDLPGMTAETATAAPEATVEPDEEPGTTAETATDVPEATVQPATSEPVETELPVTAPPQSLQTQSYIDQRMHTAWMVIGQLPQGDYQLELSFASEAEKIQPTLTRHLLNLEPELELSVEKADGESEDVLFHKPHTLTLTVDFPLGTFKPMPLDFQWLDAAAEETPSAVDAGDALPQMEWAAVPGENEGYRWQLTIPEEALPDEQNAQIRLQASVTCQEAGGKVFQTDPLTLTVVNRAPVFKGGTEEWEVYYGVPGQTEETQILFNLSSLVEDPDGDSLVYAINETVSDGVRSSCALNSETGVLSVTLTNELITMRTLSAPVTVTDGHQGSLQMDVVIRLQPFESVLNSFRLVPVSLNGKDIPVNMPYPEGSLGVNTLVYRLEGDLKGYAEARRQVPTIPPITEWIELSVDEDVVAMENLQWNDDAVLPELTLTLNAVTQHQDIAMDLVANIVHQTNGSKIPVEVGPVTIKVANSRPARTEQGPSETVARKAGIGGMPGHYTGIAFGQIFEGENTDLSQLFTDIDTPEELLYFVRTDAKVDLTPAEASDFDGEISNGLPVYALEQKTDDLLNIAVTQPGDYTFEVFAWDGEYASESVRYTVTVTSLFLRNLTIALIALGAAVLLLIIGLALRYALLPSFAGTALDIDRDHRQATVRQGSTSYSTLALSRYRKKPISLMTALIASGQFLPSAVPAEALTDILLLPGKNNTIGISVGSHAAQAGVCVQYGSQTLEGKGKLKRIAAQQPVQVLMNQARITLIVKAIRG